MREFICVIPFVSADGDSYGMGDLIGMNHYSYLFFYEQENFEEVVWDEIEERPEFKVIRGGLY